MQERILTPEQVAQLLQVHPFTVLKFIKQGKLKASKLGRVYRIRESEVERFLDQATNNTSKDSSAEKGEKGKKESKGKEEKAMLKESKKSVSKEKTASKNLAQENQLKEESKIDGFFSTISEDSVKEVMNQAQTITQPNLDTTELKVREVDVENGEGEHYYILE